MIAKNSLINFIVIFSLFTFAGQILAQERPVSWQIIENVKQHSTYLASDALQGRATGTAGERLAAEYIAEVLNKYNLIPIDQDNDYFQPIPMHGSRPMKESQLKIIFPEAEYNLELSEDYVLYKSGAQTFVPQPTPMVFVGYGIVAPEFDYNDYMSVDVSGKIVVFFDGEPHSSDPAYFDGSAPTIYSYPESKQRMAIAQGAIGSILIPQDDQHSWEHYSRQFYFEDISLAYRVTGHLGILINPDKASLLFEGCPLSLPEIKKRLKNHELICLELKSKISFRGRFSEREFITNNVAGMIPGANARLKDSYIIVSSHYDHLGVGEPVKGDSIYNGMVDNALGTAAVLEIARQFSESDRRPDRSVIFLFITGEEKGLLGSRYYIDHPLKPLYKTVANINVDGLAIFDTFNSVVGVGAGLSTLGPILEAVAGLNNLHVTPLPQQFLNYESFTRSDQMSFACAGIPSILISDGLDYRNISPAAGLNLWLDWHDNIYHTPFDDISQFINYDAVSQHISFLFDFSHRLSMMEQQPQWNPGVKFRYQRLQSIAEKK